MSKFIRNGPIILSLMPLSSTKHFTQHVFSSQFFFGTKRKPLIIKCCSSSTKDEESKESHLGFSVLKTDVQCDRGTIYSTMAFYVFSLHVPLSFGGLATVANIVHQHVLDPQTVACSLLGLQSSELLGVLLLFKNPVQPQYNVLNIFQSNEKAADRNWFLASIIGFLFILCLVFATSIIADLLLGPEVNVFCLTETNNAMLQKLLSSGATSAIPCILVYCIITPFLEELVYRGYLLTSLSSTMKWHDAVLLSSVMFSASHFSLENFLQLFAIGCVLGCSYCWTGNLSSSILIHSLYNAFTLSVAFFS